MTLAGRGMRVDANLPGIAYFDGLPGRQAAISVSRLPGSQPPGSERHFVRQAMEKVLDPGTDTIPANADGALAAARSAERPAASSRPMRIRLFDWGPSPFCMKVRAILDYKRVEYQRVSVLGPPLLEVMRRSRVRKVPALDIDGALVVDSTDIAHELERLFPEPPVLPADPQARGLSHALEDWADEALYFLGLYFQWIDPRGRPMVRKAFGATPLGVASRLFYQRRIAKQVRGQGTGRKSAAQVMADLRREYTALAGMLGKQPFLLGESPWLCDFAVNAQLVYLSRPPASAEVLEEFGPVRAYMERMKTLRASVPQA